MTAEQKSGIDGGRDPLASTSHDLGLELLGLRVNGAQLGHMLGVSRQAVSRAVKRGTIAPPGVDGLFDARRAVREWMANSDPARVRARALKPGAEAIGELRQRVQEQSAMMAELGEELELEREWGDKREAAAGFRAEADAARKLARFVRALLERFAEAELARVNGQLEDWLEELVAVAFYGQDVAEYRAMLAEDDTIDAADALPE